MFDHLKKFSKIIVTGPQRSGTTICAKMIANDLGYIYVDEEELKVDNSDYLTDRLKELIHSGDRFVVQCPALCRYVHEVGHCKDTAIIFMKRNLDEILKSQERIGWDVEEPEELKRYGDEAVSPIAQVKHDFWQDHQKWKIFYWFEVEYSSLSAHPMWVPAWQRTKFRARQTE